MEAKHRVKQLSLNKNYGLTALAIIPIIVAWSGVLDIMAKDFTNQGLMQSAAFFGSVRFLNAVISVFQEVEINFFVTSLAVGELLDPINDLIEYVSDGLKLAIGSYLLQRVIVEINSTMLFNILFTVSGIGYLSSIYMFSETMKTILYKTFLTMLFLRFSVIVSMLATTAFSASFLDDKIEKESQNTASLSQELDATRSAAENVSSDLLERIRSDIDELQSEKAELLDQIRPLEQKIRENQYDISRKQSEMEAIEDRMTMMESIRGNDELDAINREIDALEAMNDGMSDRIDDLNDRVDFVESEIERAESHLYEESNGFLKTLAGGVDSAWEKVSNLATGLVDSTLSALVLFIFKMLILPVAFLYATLKLFKQLWGIPVSEASQAARSEVEGTLKRK